MKKSILLLMMISLVGGSVLGWYSSRDSAMRYFKQTLLVPLVSENSIQAQNLVANLRVASQEETIKKAFANAKRLSDIEGQYLGLPESDLSAELDQSKKRVQDQKLIEKGDNGDLSESDAVVLLTEIRRQHVLSALITKTKIAKVRRTYL